MYLRLALFKVSFVLVWNSFKKKYNKQKNSMIATMYCLLGLWLEDFLFNLCASFNHKVISNKWF